MKGNTIQAIKIEMVKRSVITPIRPTQINPNINIIIEKIKIFSPSIVVFNGGLLTIVGNKIIDISRTAIILAIPIAFIHKLP